MAQIMTQSEFEAYVESRARVIIKEELMKNTLSNSKQSNKVTSAKQDVRGFGAKNSKGNSDTSANWTLGKPTGKKDVRINGESSESRTVKSTGGVQNAVAKTGDKFMKGHKGSKPTFSR